MGKRPSYGLLIVCGVGILSLLAVVLNALWPTLHWVGGTDLSVVFVVTDDETGQPLQGADISIVSCGGFNADGYRMEAAGVGQGTT